PCVIHCHSRWATMCSNFNANNSFEMLLPNHPNSSRCSEEMIDVTRRSSLDAATIYCFLKKTEVKSMHWIRTKDIILNSQETTPS
ncbi:hypothetical protein Q6247_26220, partial [Klebsiella pneumoniae]